MPLRDLNGAREAVNQLPNLRFASFFTVARLLQTKVYLRLTHLKTQTRVKNKTWFWKNVGDRQIMHGYICQLCLKMSFKSPMLKKGKYRFRLQKGVKNET